MKRIIDGTTYNTETATLIGQARWGWSDGSQEANMYITRGGELFIVQRPWEIPENVGRIDWAAGDLIPMSRKEFACWLAERHADDPIETRYWGGKELLEGEEAVGEPEATLYIRIPRTLKERLAAKAEADDVSLNTFVMRRVERSFEAVADVLWRAHYIAASIEAVPDGYSEQKRLEAIREMRETIETVWLDLGLPRKKGNDIREDIILHREGEILREWQPYQDIE